MECPVYWLVKCFCFEIFGDGKYGPFLIQKVDGNMISTDYFELFRDEKCGLFFEPKSWWKDDVYWLLKSSCFELFWDGKYGLFFSQKVDGKMIFTWSFWAFHDIIGLGKYGFSCSEPFKYLFVL